MFILKNIIEETSGTLLQGPDTARISGISIDSRTLKKGELFVAIKGKYFDGHRFLKQAIRKKASGLIVCAASLKIKTKIPIIRVKDTTKAFGQIAYYYRRQFDIPLVAVTGSNGKTTTKEMIAAVLGRRYRVLKNQATQNNFLGVPRTLLQLKKSHQMVVLELGTNHPGEIRWLTQITQPTVSVITNIGDSHLEFLKSRAGVFREKCDVIRYMPKRGTVILNADDPFLGRIPSMTKKHKFIFYGWRSHAQSHATKVRRANNRIHFQLRNEKFQLQTRAFHNVDNALAAISCGRLFKIRYNEIKTALNRFSFLKGRQNLMRIAGFWIMDDTYNSNPTSLRSALETFRQIGNKGRKIIICGDMLELGNASEKLHRQAGETVGTIAPDMLIAIGRYSSSVVQGFRRTNKASLAYGYSSVQKAFRKLKRYLIRGDLILIKGSRGLRLERMISLIKNEYGS
ncbi:MAG: UDP-N-acetylmuramoyl-tripeptide--D-alanyl-D-alanine ligase [Candidatus Omnitrophota bacterium]